MENLSLSVPDLLTTVKQFVEPQKHEQLDQMLQRYTQRELGEQQASSPSQPRPAEQPPTIPCIPSRRRSRPSRAGTHASPPPRPPPLTAHALRSRACAPHQLQLELRLVAGREALRRALLAMVPQIDELQKKRELMKQQQQQQQRAQQARVHPGGGPFWQLPHAVD